MLSKLFASLKMFQISKCVILIIVKKSSNTTINVLNVVYIFDSSNKGIFDLISKKSQLVMSERSFKWLSVYRISSIFIIVLVEAPQFFI